MNDANGGIDLSYDGMSEEDYVEYIEEKFGFTGSIVKSSCFVYVLKCHGATEDELKRRHEIFFGPLPDPKGERNWNRYGEWIGEEPIPKWAWAATHYSLVLYVGSTNDILERLEEHCWGTTFRSKNCRADREGNLIGVDDPTKFTKYFPPEDIRSLRMVESLEKAREVERVEALKLRTQYGDVAFVFSY